MLFPHVSWLGIGHHSCPQTNGDTFFVCPPPPQVTTPVIHKNN